MIKLKRVYEEASSDDGFRVLVDRLWPRGVSREKAKLDLWLKDIAPSEELRKWFAHDPAKWPEFQRKYFCELDENTAATEKLREIISREKSVTLLFAAKDETHNNAVALKNYLEK